MKPRTSLTVLPTAISTARLGTSPIRYLHNFSFGTVNVLAVSSFFVGRKTINETNLILVYLPSGNK